MKEKKPSVADGDKYDPKKETMDEFKKRAKRVLGIPENETPCLMNEFIGITVDMLPDFGYDKVDVKPKVKPSEADEDGECEGCVYKIWATQSCPPEKLEKDYISKADVVSCIQELDFCNLIHQARTDKISLFEAQEKIKDMVLRGLLEKKEVKK